MAPSDDSHPRTPPGAEHRIAKRQRPDDAGVARVSSYLETVAEEVPVVLVVNDRVAAVEMTTPADMVALAIGFAITEGIVADASECRDVESVERYGGWEVRLTVPEERAAALAKRLAAGPIGPTAMGAGRLLDALRPVEHPHSARVFERAAIDRALAEFPHGRPLLAATGATHAAAFCTPEGHVEMTREDVDRHNALDKLIGAMAGAGLAAGDGFVVISGRCSHAVVHKAAVAGFPMVVSVSAPTGAAVDLAARIGLGLAAIARDGGLSIYAGERRFVI